ncbi:MAG: transcriptional regulator [Chlorobi bacterium]|nr:transcriptional regulator [Chlorobiota bacterium]
MEIQNFKDNIKVFYVKADSFPAGIKAAHNKLHSLLPSTVGRRFFGISYPARSGSIIYKAAVEESLPGEAEKYGCETFVIKKGDYLSHTVSNWRKDESAIANGAR